MHNIIVVQSNLDYPDSLRPDERARIIENMNIKANQTSFECSSLVTTRTGAAFCLFKAKQTRLYLAFQRCTFKKTMATDLDHD